ncbi:homeobox protein Nkx-2.8-like [Photinus pyralis]|uniref:homeobox protein Nkx-2.8-like n=1 Tax=Photinus pyralis TaxID=7054 RepID=UPI00126742A3|nr:homeobox protein Nkx-2.8-like [Photinus pyralis]
MDSNLSATLRKDDYGDRTMGEVKRAKGCRKRASILIKQFYNLHSSSSPRRVAVPVLVKDGKPCAGGSGNQTSTATSSDASRAQQSPATCPPQQQSQCMANGGLAMAYRQQGNYQQQCGTYLPLQARAW